MYIARIVFNILTVFIEIGLFTLELKEIQYLIAVPSTKPGASLLPSDGCH